MKSKLIVVLFGILLFLIILNVFAEVFVKQKDPPPPKELSADTLNVIFWDALRSYGIPSDWVAARRVSSEDYDSINQILKIQVPPSITPLQLLNELNSRIPVDYATLFSIEREINGNCDVLIYSNEYLKLKAEFRKNRNISIQQPSLSFLVDNSEDLDSEKFNELLFSSFSFGVLFRPSSENRVRAEQIISNKKEYFILLDDEIAADLYRIENGMDGNEIAGTIKNISAHFKGAKEIFYDPRADVFRSVLFNFIRDKFFESERELIEISRLSRIEEKEDEDIESLFNFYIENLELIENNLFLIDAEVFMELNNELALLKKRGYRIVYPSVMINR